MSGLTILNKHYTNLQDHPTQHHIESTLQTAYFLLEENLTTPQIKRIIEIKKATLNLAAAQNLAPPSIPHLGLQPIHMWRQLRYHFSNHLNSTIQETPTNLIHPYYISRLVTNLLLTIHTLTSYSCPTLEDRFFHLLLDPDHLADQTQSLKEQVEKLADSPLLLNTQSIQTTYLLLRATTLLKSHAPDLGHYLPRIQQHLPLHDPLPNPPYRPPSFPSLRPFFTRLYQEFLSFLASCYYTLKNLLPQ